MLYYSELQKQSIKHRQTRLDNLGNEAVRKKGATMDPKHRSGKGFCLRQSILSKIRELKLHLYVLNILCRHF